MAVAAWVTYDSFHRHIMDGTVQLSTTVVDMHLVMSTSNFSTTTLSSLGSLTLELGSARGYSQSGIALTDTWTTGASTGEMRYDATAVVWTAAGGDLGSTSAATQVLAAVLVARTGDSGKNTANKLVAWSKLSTSSFTVTDGNTLTITPSANGIFELNRA
ncbi:hypothetical protein LCGC14_2892580 [marine sediment metagenome]|uniref:Uncharacterized protein n=1 Tax=marine sediment metagenome TaxID=412755 RepID=A0A0F8XX54_9ZZZZ